MIISYLHLSGNLIWVNFDAPQKIIPVPHINSCEHRLRTPNEGINQRYLENWADVADKFGIGIEFLAVQWRLFPLWASVVVVVRDVLISVCFWHRHVWILWCQRTFKCQLLYFYLNLRNIRKFKRSKFIISLIFVSLLAQNDTKYHNLKLHNFIKIIL